MTGAPFPNFVIIGVSRAGTTAIFDTLVKHPDIFGAAKKETRYFQAIRYGEPLAPIEQYQAFFRQHSGQPVIMESTPDYFYGGKATATVIRDTCQPRVMLIFREPATRLVSFYQLMKASLQIPADLSLADYLDRCRALPDSGMDERANNAYTGVWTGQYARFLPPWLELFGDRLDIAFFDDLTADPTAVLAEQCRRLGVDPAQLPAEVATSNPSRAYRSPALQRAAAATVKRGRRLFYYHPRFTSLARRAYEAANQRPVREPPVSEPLMRQIRSMYEPWNHELRGQLLAAGHDRLPAWLAA